jgi:hypothetical protein
VREEIVLGGKYRRREGNAAAAQHVVAVARLRAEGRPPKRNGPTATRSSGSTLVLSLFASSLSRSRGLVAQTYHVPRLDVLLDVHWCPLKRIHGT